MYELWKKYQLPTHTGNPPMAMDYRHVMELLTTITEAQPRVAVEIGSYQGHSTVAFIEAMHILPDMYLHVFEPYPTPELRRVLAAFPNRITLHTTPIWGSSVRPDFAFIDGDHGIPALADLAYCLARNTPVIAMHDTNGFTCGLTPEGSEQAATLLREMPSRSWLEDKGIRVGEFTQRGFGVSTIRDL